MITNNQEKIFRSLKSTKGRREHGLFIAEGFKVIRELLTSQYVVELILCSTEAEFGTGVHVERCSQKVIDRISSMRNPSSEIAVVQIPDTTTELQTTGPLFLLENIQDPGNLGTMMRTLRWFGADQLVVSEDCADILNPKVIQASMGAIFHLNVIKGPLSESISILKDAGLPVFATEMAGDASLLDKATDQLALVIGNEGHGISDRVLEACDGSISIPGAGLKGVESLNAAISLGILVHQLFKNGNNG